MSPLVAAEESDRGIAIVLDDLTEKRRLEAQRRLFERMVSPAVINQLDPDSLQLGGRLSVITTLFADIRGYTSFSEVTDPETLVTVLNRYLAAAANSILHEDGTIDKFLGDEVMAWFNAPIPQADHTLRAIRAALTMQEQFHELSKSGKTSTDLNEIITAAQDGKVDTLFLKKNGDILGQYKTEPELQDSGNITNSTGVPLLNFAALKVFEQGGKVFLEGEEDLPDSSSEINAVFRY